MGNVVLKCGIFAKLFLYCRECKKDIVDFSGWDLQTEITMGASCLLDFISPRDIFWPFEYLDRINGSALANRLNGRGLSIENR